ncbi:MAG: metal ABC transporter substrate-binding protein [Thermoproteota archaeon]
MPRGTTILTLIMLNVITVSIYAYDFRDYSQQSRIRIVITIDVLKSIVKPIVSDYGEVASIVPEEAEPHSFTLTPSVVSDALNSELIVITGHMEWERKLVERVSESRGAPPDGFSLNLMELPGIRILDLMGGRNIHGFWLLPDNAILIARALEDKLSRLRPEHSQDFYRNLAEFEKRVSGLKSFLGNLSAKHEFTGKSVVIGFYAEQYVVEAMGLRVGAVLIGEGEAINPETLSRVYSGFRLGEYLCIVVSDTALKMGGVQNSLKEITEETGSPVAYVSVVSTRGIDYYDELMYYSSGQVYNALLSIRKQVSGGFNIYLVIVVASLLAILVETLILLRRRV